MTISGKRKLLSYAMLGELVGNGLFYHLFKRILAIHMNFFNPCSLTSPIRNTVPHLFSIHTIYKRINMSL